MIRKACILMTRAAGAQVLLMAHPKAGWQLVKGTIEPGEDPKQAALREFLEETGRAVPSLTALSVITPIPDQTWFLFHGQGDELPECWTHHAPDDGGLDLSFFWHPHQANAPQLGRRYQMALQALP